jgi:hypothetical protein
MAYTQEQIESAKNYIKFEILENHHGIMGRQEASEYCGSKTLEIWFALVGTIGEVNAMDLINSTSEQHHAEIEAKTLAL